MGDIPGDGPSAWLPVDELPVYLQQEIKKSTFLSQDSNNASSVTSSTSTERVLVLELAEISVLETKEDQRTGLLLLRHHVTQEMAGWDQVLKPELILKRAWCHERLGYDELAVADAYAAYTLASGESEDLVERTVDDENEEWDVEGVRAAEVRVDSVRVLVLGLRRLGAATDVATWEAVLKREGANLGEEEEEGEEKADAHDKYADLELEGIHGRCQRVVYPWNSHEPDRMSTQALAEINSRLQQASDGMLECRRAVLPSLSLSVSTTAATASGDEGENAQLGLFATRRLDASTTTAILRERSCLTAIRPHDAALCDCCAGDLEKGSDRSSQEEDDDEESENVVACPGCPTTTLFCSRECLDLAVRSYHRPFCSGADADADASDDEGTFTDLGRAESSTTPEWDLYFLLVVRCIQMAITQDVHPLDLFEVKYLWGGFATDDDKPKLPFSFHHHVSLPFQLFETLLLRLPELYPYSRAWLRRFDFWTVNTLLAKFRGVATASQSTFDGRAETAAVHALWCLANHSCAPNVEWAAGGGVRVLRLRRRRAGDESAAAAAAAIGEGEQVWNHYTDVREPDVRVRRARLWEVLGGACMCERCVREDAGEGEGER